ncbi:glucans biosynthesis protein C [Nocardiopsis flavescens]|uniref:Glucans biosynthesis protein C n=1 Tax=Nocardiopsis flavescens TaxID=758803 RepID=A0A1M6QSI6_9ACTN|nr:acyltransferase family protein [Nocardiopsis flavescens]SHK23166.1 glucans biosynthesis protein C [Nocardiopsis flavescens]
MTPRTTGTATAGEGPARVRIHGLDALRGSALLLGILLHSLMPFAPEMPWLVVDDRSSPLAFAGVYVIHLFRMTLFMLLAGYLGRMVLVRRGPRSYFRDRVVRILLPLFAFWPVSVFSLGVIATVAAGTGTGGTPAPPPIDAPLVLLVFTPGQLWFLLVLFEIIVLVLVARAVLLRVLGPERAGRWSARIGGALSHPAGVLLAAVPYAAALLLQGGDPAQGIMAPPTVLPEAAPLVGYLGAFLAGWFLHAAPDALGRMAPRWPLLLAPAVLGTVFMVLPVAAGLPAAAGAGVVALTGLLWTYGLTAFMVKVFSREHAVVRYLADASYWMYLMHLPLLVAIEVPLAGLEWPIMAKLLLTWTVTTALLLGGYQLLVRRTALGRWLNGTRRRSGPRADAPGAPARSGGDGAPAAGP